MQSGPTQGNEELKASGDLFCLYFFCFYSEDKFLGAIHGAVWILPLGGKQEELEKMY